MRVQKLGRTIDRREVVHHRDGDKLNNAPENLMVIGTMYPLVHAQPIRTRIA
jgi:HNH endonuclease